MMGIAKNSNVYFPELLEVMNRHLVEAYSAVYPQLRGFQDSRLLENFGSHFSAVALHLYSHAAKEFDEKRLLNLDSVFEDTAEVQDVVNHLSQKSVSIGNITFMENELKGAWKLSVIMNRMRRCRAGLKLHYIASIIDQKATSVDDLPDELQYLVSAVATTLGKPEAKVFENLKNLRLIQEQTGKQNAEMNRLVNQLARKYNNAEDGNDDAYSLEDDEDLNTYCTIANVDHVTAMKRVKDTASSYNITFWRNYRALKIYLDTYQEDIITVEGNNIVTIKKDRLDRNNNRYDYLYTWLYSMNGYRAYQYGLVAHERPGSVEYEALSNLGVSFDDRLNEIALAERLDSIILEREDKFSGLMDF